ncbi:MAG: ATP-binding protein [Anaerolineae bacterium]|jgi:PAS domain S-box-containing protein
MSSEVEPDRAPPGRDQESHRLLLEALSHGIQENDCQGMITYSNRAHHLILGYEPGELVGRAIWDFQPSATERASLRDYFFRLVEEQPLPAPYVTRCRKEDGTLVDLQIDWNYMYYPDGTLKGFISLITDITDRRRAEEALCQRTQGLATLLEVSENLAETLDMQHILQATVDGVTKLVGLDTAAVYLLEEEMLHLWATTPPLPPQFPAELRVAHLADHPHLGKAISSGRAVLVPDIRGVDLTPAERSITEQRNLRTVLYLPLIVDEKAMGAFIVGSIEEPSELSDAALDLSHTLANLAALAVRNAQLYQDGQNYAAQLEETLADRIRAEEERNRLQAQLLQVQKMESLGQLAGGIAHDFNNILVPIIGYVELGMRKLSPDDKLYGDLKQIYEAAERAAALTRQILAYSRKQVLEMRPTDVNELVVGFGKMLRRLIGENIQLQTNLAPSVELIMADRGQLEQVLMNLALNARDAMPEGGQLTIETDNVFLDEQYAENHIGMQPGPYVMLAVSDTGQGMSSETQRHIFEPFFSTKEKGEGTGLGLATVFGIVKQHQGNIGVYSEPGKGSVFKIYLPQAAQVEQIVESTGMTEQLSLYGKETVLVVEDDALVSNLVCETLETYGYQVLKAKSPKQGLQRAASHPTPIDLLLTDVIMPQMNGQELYQKMTRVEPEIKVLYMSGYTDSVIVHHGMLEEGIHFLQKPFTVRDLVQKVRVALS